jgi:hypothetical protein
MPIHDWSKVPAGVFHDFHLSWVHDLRDTLNEKLLPEPFYALAEPVAGEAVPDVITLQSQTPAQDGRDPRLAPRAGSSVMNDSAEGNIVVATSPVFVQEIALEPYDILARRIAIHSEWEGDAIVAVIEFVSRGNKTSQVKVEQFVKKSVSFLEKGIHVLFMDLHAPTKVVPAGFHAKILEEYGVNVPPPEPDRLLSAVSYQVREAGKICSRAVALKIGDRMPEMPVFIRPHEFVRAPLETTYEQAFRSVPRKYRERLASGA